MVFRPYEVPKAVAILIDTILANELKRVRRSPDLETDVRNAKQLRKILHVVDKECRSLIDDISERVDALQALKLDLANGKLALNSLMSDIQEQVTSSHRETAEQQVVISRAMSLSDDYRDIQIPLCGVIGPVILIQSTRYQALPAAIDKFLNKPPVAGVEVEESAKDETRIYVKQLLEIDPNRMDNQLADEARGNHLTMRSPSSTVTTSGIVTSTTDHNIAGTSKGNQKASQVNFRPPKDFERGESDLNRSSSSSLSSLASSSSLSQSDSSISSDYSYRPSAASSSSSSTTSMSSSERSTDQSSDEAMGMSSSATSSSSFLSSSHSSSSSKTTPPNSYSKKTATIPFSKNNPTVPSSSSSGTIPAVSSSSSSCAIPIFSSSSSPSITIPTATPSTQVNTIPLSTTTTNSGCFNSVTTTPSHSQKASMTTPSEYLTDLLNPLTDPSRSTSFYDSFPVSTSNLIAAGHPKTNLILTVKSGTMDNIFSLKKPATVSYSPPPPPPPPPPSPLSSSPCPPSEPTPTTSASNFPGGVENSTSFNYPFELTFADILRSVSPVQTTEEENHQVPPNQSLINYPQTIQQTVKRKIKEEESFSSCQGKITKDVEYIDISD